MLPRCWHTRLCWYLQCQSQSVRSTFSPSVTLADEWDTLLPVGHSRFIINAAGPWECQLFLPQGISWGWLYGSGQASGVVLTGGSTLPYLENLLTLRGHLCTLSIYFISLGFVDCSTYPQLTNLCTVYQNQALLSLLLSHRTYL